VTALIKLSAVFYGKVARLSGKAQIGSEHLREIRTMMSTPTEPDRLYGAFIAILIYDLLETGQEEL
jgi:hypothetical protein